MFKLLSSHSNSPGLERVLPGVTIGGVAMRKDVFHKLLVKCCICNIGLASGFIMGCCVCLVTFLVSTCTPLCMVEHIVTVRLSVCLIITSGPLDITTVSPLGGLASFLLPVWSQSSTITCSSDV